MHRYRTLKKKKKKTFVIAKNEGEQARVCALYSRATVDECRKSEKEKREAIAVVVTGASIRTLSL